MSNPLIPQLYISITVNYLLFLGLSPVRVKSKEAVEVTKSTTLHCDYFLDNENEQLYSVLWYWTPKSSTYSSIDLRLMDKSGLSLPPQLPQGPVQFFRYRKGDEDGKKAWDNQLRGIFSVNVSEIHSFILSKGKTSQPKTYNPLKPVVGFHILPIFYKLIE